MTLQVVVLGAPDEEFAKEQYIQKLKGLGYKAVGEIVIRWQKTLYFLSENEDAIVTSKVRKRKQYA